MRNIIIEEENYFNVAVIVFINLRSSLQGNQKRKNEKNVAFAVRSRAKSERKTNNE